MTLFITIFLSIWGAMHAYVFWRIASIPAFAHLVPTGVLAGIAAALWLSYLFARILDSKGLQSIVWPVEYFAANWVGVLFLLFFAFLSSDLATLVASLFNQSLSGVHSWAAIIALGLALIAWIQGLRPPVVTNVEVLLPGLPRERDGLVLLQLSDLHLGNLLGRKWLKHLVERVNAMRPDVIAITGDLVDGNVGRVEPLRDVVEELKAPLGIWAVTGNHEYYAGLDRSIRLFQAAGFKVLRDEHKAVVPGLVFAGVDDLTARDKANGSPHPFERALANRPVGGVVLLSHTPQDGEKAAAAGAGLMLSGHTHNGQVWPFTLLVRLRHKLAAGRYQVGAMTAIVCRGTGTWGPRMRLWQPSEMMRITLRSPEAMQSPTRAQ